MIQPSSTQIHSEFDVNEKIHTKITKFVDIFRPVYYFSRLCGQMPFSMVQQTLHSDFYKPQVGRRDALWFTISMVSYTTVTIFTCLKLTAKFDQNKTVYVLFMGNSMLHSMTMLFGVVKLAMDMYNRHKLVSILNKFTQFDHKVRIIEPFTTSIYVNKQFLNVA